MVGQHVEELQEVGVLIAGWKYKQLQSNIPPFRKPRTQSQYINVKFDLSVVHVRYEVPSQW
jgi:hypothetical protein